MGKRRKHSKIDQLEPAVKETVDEMIKTGAYYREIVDYIQSSDLRMKMDTLCAQQMQKPLYAGTVENVLKSWGVILLIGVLCIAVGILSLEFIDRDKR